MIPSIVKNVRQLSVVLLAAGIMSACSTTPKQEPEPVTPVAVAKPVKPLAVKPLELTQTPRGPMITLDDVLFDFEKDSLRPEARSIARQAAQWLKKNPDRVAVVQGHTDHTGPSEFNQILSERRAQAIRAALLDEGVPYSRIRVKGFGMTRPVASNNTREGRQANRRVEIVFTQAKRRLAS